MADSRKNAPSADSKAASYILRSHVIEAPSLAAGLYIVATPIGNLSDITVRALDVLAAADLIACEDTRVSRKLLTRYGIETHAISYNDYSDNSKRQRIIGAVRDGKSVALVSDAGTPLISDPGYRLVAELRKEGLPVVPVPGPSSVLAALSGAGLPTDRFHFTGFPPAKAGARRRELAALAALDATLVLLESPNRLAATLADAADVFGGETEACVCRELTKLHETFDRGSLAELATRYDGRQVKGEIVMLIHSAGGKADYEPEEVDRLISAALAGGSVRQAADVVAAETGLPRRMLYQRALALKSSQNSNER
jgi:16S rRNA (cytidine1402-2'-O)-methyltransferase